MAQGSATGPTPGIYVRGELRGGVTVEGRERPGGEGRWPSRYRLSLAVGPDTMRIEYADEATARRAVEVANEGPAVIGDMLTLPVEARAGAKGGADAYVFWSGRGERTEPEVSW